MTESFIKLEQDNDIVMLDKDTFTVSRLKELLNDEIALIFQENNNQSLSSRLYNIQIPIHNKSPKLDLDDIFLIFPQHGLEAKLLKINSGNWFDIKLRVYAAVKITFDQTSKQHLTQLGIELEYQIDHRNEEEQNNINYDNSLDKIRAELNEMKTV